MLQQTAGKNQIWIHWRTLVVKMCVELGVLCRKNTVCLRCVQTNCINIFENVPISIEALYKVQGVLNVHRFTFKTEFWLKHLVEIDVS